MNNRADEVLRQQTALMARNFPITMLTSFMAAVLTTLATQHLIQKLALWTWFGSHAIASAGMFAWFRLYVRSYDPHQAARWMVTCVAVMGISWGSFATVSVFYGDSLGMLYAMAILSGVASGWFGLSGPIFRASLAFLIPTSIAVSSGFFYLGGASYTALGMMIPVYFLLLYLQMGNIEKASIRSIELRMENTDLVEKLRQESHQADLARTAADTARAAADTARAAADTARAAADTARATADTACQAAEQANTDKSKFLAAASHDLRQPLHAIGMFLEALQLTDLNDQQQLVLKHSKTASNAAGDMLTTLLDFSRLDAGVVHATPKAFNVQMLLGKLEQVFGAQADAKNLVYRTRETKLAAHADLSLVNLVMHNLISNAIRYTHKGGLMVSCRKRAGRLVLEVWDTGIGIAEQDQASVFKEFHQLGNSERDHRKGLGLGLAIVQRLVQEMGTQIQIVSRPGRGSVFRLWLDKYEVHLPDESLSIPATLNLQGLYVLVVDDEESVRLGMQELLVGWGCICRAVEDLPQALLAVRHLLPDVVISDYRLRDNVNGGQVIEALRGVAGRKLPAIIITGDTAPERLREAQKTQAVLLHKPVSTGDLRKILQELAH